MSRRFERTRLTGLICTQVIESVRVMLEAGADPTLQTSRQAMMTDRIYKERFFPHELLADANGIYFGLVLAQSGDGH